MKKITEKHIKQIKHGNHAILMDCLDFLLDSYDDDKWSSGYKSCMDDLSVRSQRLAGVILESTTIAGLKALTNEFEVDAEEKLAKVIENYFTKAMKS